MLRGLELVTDTYVVQPRQPDQRFRIGLKLVGRPMEPSRIALQISLRLPVEDFPMVFRVKVHSSGEICKAGATASARPVLLSIMPACNFTHGPAQRGAGQNPHEFLIGRALGRWCGNPDAQRPVMLSNYATARGAGHNANRKMKRAIAFRTVNHESPTRQAVAG